LDGHNIDDINKNGPQSFVMCGGGGYKGGEITLNRRIC